MGLVQELEGVGSGLLHGEDGLGFALGLEDRGLLFGLGLEDAGFLLGAGAEDGGFLFALCNQDRGVLLALGLEDGLTAVTLGLHLLLHGVLDVSRRQDVLELHAGDLDAPGVGRLVEDGAHLGVDDVAGGQGLVELQIADDITKGGGGQGLHGDHRLLHAIGIELRIGDGEVDHGVDLHGDVILGDDGLGRIVQDLLLEGDALGDPIQERDQSVDADAPDGLVGAQALDYVGVGLLDHVDVLEDDPGDDQDDGCDNDDRCILIHIETS